MATISSRNARDVRRIAARMEVYAAYLRDRATYSLDEIDKEIDLQVDREIAEENEVN